jgi:hypothetical protein
MKKTKKNMGKLDNGQTSCIRGLLDFSDQFGLGFGIEVIVNDCLIKNGVGSCWRDPYPLFEPEE